MKLKQITKLFGSTFAASACAAAVMVGIASGAQARGVTPNTSDDMNAADFGFYVAAPANAYEVSDSANLVDANEEASFVDDGGHEVRRGGPVRGSRRVTNTNSAKILSAFNTEILGSSFVFSKTSAFSEISATRTAAEGVFATGRETVVTSILVEAGSTNAQIVANANARISIGGLVSPTNSAGALALIKTAAPGLASANWGLVTLGANPRENHDRLSASYVFTATGTTSGGIVFRASGIVLTRKNGNTVVDIEVGTGSFAVQKNGQHQEGPRQGRP